MGRAAGRGIAPGGMGGPPVGLQVNTQWRSEIQPLKIWHILSLDFLKTKFQIVGFSKGQAAMEMKPNETKFAVRISNGFWLSVATWVFHGGAKILKST